MLHADTNTDSIARTKSPAPRRRRTAARAELPGFGGIVGQSSAMLRMYRQIEDVAPTDATVLIVGESGTGKELVARSVWQHSPRSGNAFVAINCGGIPASLLEAQLFGHERGSFTGAHQRSAGYFETAHGGTLFLDEITEMPLPMQTVLLRALEERRIRRVGGEADIPVDVRVLAATNRDPEQAVRNGLLREDLLYRLSVFPIEVPPLRHREDDIELLARHFLTELNAESGSHRRLSSRSIAVLRSYPWPGNVRELRNAIQRAYILAEDEVELVPGEVSLRAATRVEGNALSIALGTSLADAQRDLILATLAHLRGDKERTAKVLGICLKTLYNRLQAYQEVQGTHRPP
jgi:DNA-binding NtrC family response regulator